MKIERDLIVQSVTKSNDAESGREEVRLEGESFNTLAWRPGEFRKLEVEFVAPLGTFKAGQKMRLTLETDDE